MASAGNNLGTNPRKRQYNNRRQQWGRRDKQRRIETAVSSSTLSQDHSGYLFSCAPRSEDRAFRDAVYLLQRTYEDYEKNNEAPPPAVSSPAAPDKIPDKTPEPAEAKPSGTIATGDATAAKETTSSEGDKTTATTAPDSGATTTDSAVEAPNPDPASAAPPTGARSVSATAALDAELTQLRTERPSFTRVDNRLSAGVFIAPPPDGPPLAAIVELALRTAQRTGRSGTRYCHRLSPVHATCHADAPAAGVAAGRVARAQFPPAPASFAVVYRARLNNGAKRDTYITATAEAVAAVDARYTVNLKEPDVVLLVEVIKNVCCVGAFEPYYELAKLNLHEAACPSDKATPKKTPSAGDRDGTEPTKSGVNTEPKQNGARKMGDINTEEASEPSNPGETDPQKEETSPLKGKIQTEEEPQLKVSEGSKDEPKEETKPSDADNDTESAKFRGESPEVNEALEKQHDEKTSKKSVSGTEQTNSKSGGEGQIPEKAVKDVSQADAVKEGAEGSAAKTVEESTSAEVPNT